MASDDGVERISANHERGWRTVGGWLVVSSDSMTFRPHWLERAFRSKEWTRALHEIRSVEVAPVALRQAHVGGLRRRLRVVLADGTTEHFVVTHPDDVAARLARRLEA